MFTDLEKGLVKSSWAQILPLADSFADAFYKRSFELRPDYRTLFPLDMSSQKRKLLRLLAFAVNSLSFADSEGHAAEPAAEDLLQVALALGRGRDPLYRVPREAVQTFGDALIYALEQTANSHLTPEAQSAWRRLYAALELAMQLGSAHAEERALSLSSEQAQDLCERALLAQLASAESLRARLELSEGPA